MGLIQVNVVGLKSTKASFDRSKNMMTINAGSAATYRRDKPTEARATKLCGDDEGVSVLILHPFANNLFGPMNVGGVRGNRIDLGGIKKIDSRFDSTVHDSK
jgi:hypothetical protein